MRMTFLSTMVPEVPPSCPSLSKMEPRDIPVAKFYRDQETLKEYSFAFQEA